MRLCLYKKQNKMEYNIPQKTKTIQNVYSIPKQLIPQCIHFGQTYTTLQLTKTK